MLAAKCGVIAISLVVLLTTGRGKAACPAPPVADEHNLARIARRAVVEAMEREARQIASTCTKLVFVHVPKTAGTSIGEWLTSNLGKKSVLGYRDSLTPIALHRWLNDTNDQGVLSRGTQAIIIHCRASCIGVPGVSGDPLMPGFIRRLIALRDTHPAVCKLRLVTVLREPMSHLRSTWLYENGKKYSNFRHV